MMAILTPELLLKAISEVGLTDWQESILSTVRNSVRVVCNEALDNENELPLGTSKIGGLPDLPPDVQWPQWKDFSLSFVAQINLEEASVWDKDGLLPKRGLLSFFCNETLYWSDEFTPFNREWWHVNHFDGDFSNLRRASNPGNFSEPRHLYRPCSVTFHLEVTLPPILFYYPERLLNAAQADKSVEDRFYSLKMGVYNVMEQGERVYPSYNRLLGYPDDIQDDIFRDAHYIQSGTLVDSDTVYDDPNSGIRNWVLLFQLGSDDKARMMWGDVGRLYYCIQREALAAHKFEKTICTMQYG